MTVGSSSASPKLLPAGSGVAKPCGRRSASSRASEAPLACRPLEPTSTISSPSASSAPRIGATPSGRAPTAAPASSISCAASIPGSVGDSPPPHTQPASSQPRRQPSSSAVGALAVLVPARVAGGEVGVDDERQGPHADEVVEDRGDRVVGDVVEAVDALLLEHRTGDQRLRAEPLEHQRERALAELEHERRLAAGGVEGPAPARAEQRGGRQGAQHRQALGGVERVVVDARVAIAGALCAHRG